MLYVYGTDYLVLLLSRTDRPTSEYHMDSWVQLLKSTVQLLIETSLTPGYLHKKRYTQKNVTLHQLDISLTWGKFIYVAREEVHVITGHETHLDYWL